MAVCKYRDGVTVRMVTVGGGEGEEFQFGDAPGSIDGDLYGASVHMEMQLARTCVNGEDGASC